MTTYDSVTRNNMSETLSGADAVNESNMFEVFRDIQLIAMSLIWANDSASAGGNTPPDGYFPDRIIRYNIPAGFQTRLVAHAEPETIGSDTIFIFSYEYILEII